MAKSVYGMAHTRQLIERLRQDAQLRIICGFAAARHLPHKSTFWRAFAEFASMELPQFVHEVSLVGTLKDRLIGHNASRAVQLQAP